MTTIERAQRRLKLIETRNTQIAKLKALRADLRRQKEKVAQDMTELEALRQGRNAAFKTARQEFEAEVIKRALTLANGEITGASRIMGVSYQWLAYMIEKRHAALLTERRPIVRRTRRKARTR